MDVVDEMIGCLGDLEPRMPRKLLNGYACNVAKASK
jgi:hypothetical protein